MPRYRAALKAMSCGAYSNRSCAPAVVFDVVPHRLYETYTLRQFRDITEGVNILDF